MGNYYYRGLKSWPKYAVLAGTIFLAVNAIGHTSTSGSGGGSETESGGSASNITVDGPNPMTSGPNVTTGEDMAEADGFTGQQVVCLNWLWTHESGWQTTATNGQSGAYGIPQSLPADKMAAAGSDWQSDPATQIRWGLGYIKSVYGSPCGAWEHEVSNDWY